MRVEVDVDVDLYEADLDELLDELARRVEYKKITIEEVVNKIEKKTGQEHTDKDILTEQDLIKWKDWARVK